MSLLTKLHAVHREILRLHVLGYSAMDIANELGVTAAMVNITLGSELGQLALESMQAEADREVMDVTKQLAQNAMESEKFLGRIVSGTEEVSTSLRARVCMDQLDRAGFGKVTRTVNYDLQGSLTEEEIREIKENARQMRNVVTVEALT